MTEYTIRHRTLGDVGGFSSMTAATLEALGFGWPLEEWTIEPVEAPRPASTRPRVVLSSVPPSPARDRVIAKWGRA